MRRLLGLCALGLGVWAEREPAGRGHFYGQHPVAFCCLSMVFNVFQAHVVFGKRSGASCREPSPAALSCQLAKGHSWLQVRGHRWHEDRRGPCRSRRLPKEVGQRGPKEGLKRAFRSRLVKTFHLQAMQTGAVCPFMLRGSLPLQRLEQPLEQHRAATPRHVFTKALPPLPFTCSKEFQ